MNLSHLADVIIVSVAVTYIVRAVLIGIVEIATVITEWNARRRKNAMHKRWVAARIAAREECEARMKRDGYWDNFEIQDAMRAAGEAIAPGYRV